MAKIEKIVTKVLQWEAGLNSKYSALPLREQYAQACKTGWSDDPADRGGATMCGITLDTFKTYCSRKGCPIPVKQDLREMSYSVWLDIIKILYWDRWIADKITSQSVANILVDWTINSGSYGIKIPQRLLGVQADGVVGAKTLSQLNSVNARNFFEAAKAARIDFVNNIAKNNPSQVKFLKGWLNRINSFKFES